MDEQRAKMETEIDGHKQTIGDKEATILDQTAAIASLEEVLEKKRDVEA